MAVDQMVLATQNWLNDTYGSDPRFETVPENGKTGWPTIYGLIRALQIELGIQNTSNNFGPTTQSLFTPIQRDDEICNHLFGIVEGALWCKGYNPGHYAVQVNGRNHISQVFDLSVENAVKQVQEDAGRSTQSGIVDLNTMKALLSMDSFVCISSLGGKQKIRAMQQYLNRNYEPYIGLTPCDGIYGRTTNKALIYAIQSEEGLSISTANGNFGPSTRTFCPTIPYDNVATNKNGTHYNIQSISKFINILKISLYCNGFGDGDLDGSFSLDDEIAVRNFQTEYAINITGIVNLGTWLSLLLSCGDVNRSALACDTATKINEAKAASLYNAGFRYVGRYLTKVEGGLDKNLTREEIKTILSKGLSIFPIFQEYGGAASAFNETIGREHAEKARRAAESLGIPYYTTIYFAVDFDPLQTEIYSNVYPYFKAIYDYFHNSGLYNVGVYGTRNVCRILKLQEEENDFKIYNMFVADASSGFSGNLGFSLPNGWSFDQFCVDLTIGSGSGAISIDKVAVSGKDLGFNKIDSDSFEIVYDSISTIYNEALDYTNNDVDKSNQLTLQYIRKGDYGNDTYFGGNGIIDNIKWEIIAGSIDGDFCNLIDSKYPNLRFNFLDPKTNQMHLMSHFAATLNALLWPIKKDDWVVFDSIVDAYAGWVGDVVTFSETIEKNTQDIENIQSWADNNICSQNGGNFNTSDYIDDIDAFNISVLIKNSNYNLPDAFKLYFDVIDISSGEYEYEKRTNNFIVNLGMTNFLNLCTDICGDDFPYDTLNNMLTNVDKKYIIAAVEAFKKYIANEMQNEIS